MNADQIRGGKSSQKRSNNKQRKKEECLKVVYISSPMKVKTSASEFRSLVQQLTGKHSDISQYGSMGDQDDFLDCRAKQLETSTTTTTSDDDSSTFQKLSSDDTPTTSSDYSHMDNVFGAIFSSDSFYDPSQMDVLGSFDELL